MDRWEQVECKFATVEEIVSHFEYGKMPLDQQDFERALHSFLKTQPRKVLDPHRVELWDRPNDPSGYYHMRLARYVEKALSIPFLLPIVNTEMLENLQYICKREAVKSVNEFVVRPQCAITGMTTNLYRITVQLRRAQQQVEEENRLVPLTGMGETGTEIRATIVLTEPFADFFDLFYYAQRFPRYVRELKRRNPDLVCSYTEFDNFDIAMRFLEIRLADIT